MLIGGEAIRYNNYNTLSNNYFPPDPASVQFVNYANGGMDYHNYALANASPYKNAATDGRDIGVDFGELEAALAMEWACAPMVGVKAVFEESDFQLWPNPFWAKVVLASSTELDHALLLLYNLYGQEVKCFSNLNGNRFELNLEDLPTGMYHYKVLQSNQVLFNGNLIGIGNE